MHTLLSSLKNGLLWISRDPAGNAIVRDASGHPLPGVLEPSLDEALAGSDSDAQPRRLTFRDPSGRVRALEVLPVAGDAGILLALDCEIGSRLVAPTVENLVNQIAHDVRNYAFTMGLQAELGLRRAAAMPEAKGHFEAVLRQVEALKSYLEQLLLFGRPAPLSPAAVDVPSLLRQVVQSYQLSRSAGSRPLDVRIEIGADVPVATWDARALGTALRALLDNAARSSDPPPPITILLGSEGEAITLEVRDAGAGISPENLAKLAMPMRLRRAGGAGLGIAIARKMVAAHGGQLEIHSGATGTTVSLLLPREARPE